MLIFAGFGILGVLLMLLIILNSRKEFPSFLVFYVLLQYGVTLGLWFLNLTERHSAVLVVFLWLTTFLLIWARNLNYSKELFSIRLFFSVSQWAVILVLLLFISLKSPYYYVFPTGENGHFFSQQHLSLHPIVKLSANILIFTTFFHIILQWGQKWKPSKSLLDLGPILLYIFMLLILRGLMDQVSIFPHT